MTRYLISFDDGAMDDIPEEALGDAGRAAHAVVAEAQAAGAWIFGAGLHTQQSTVVGTDGSVTDGPFPETKAVLGGFAIVDVASHDEALTWAAKFADACRCAQEVRELMYDPDV
jgi:hypothetical protein